MDFTIKNPTKTVLLVSNLHNFIEVLSILNIETENSGIKLNRSWDSIRSMNFAQENKEPTVFLVNSSAPIPKKKFDMIVFFDIEKERYMEKFLVCKNDDCIIEM